MRPPRRPKQMHRLAPLTHAAKDSPSDRCPTQQPHLQRPAHLHIVIKDDQSPGVWASFKR
jgi:hypothetical protein